MFAGLTLREIFLPSPQTLFELRGIRLTLLIITRNGILWSW